MSVALAGWAALCLGFAGMAALSLGMVRHYEQWTGQRSVPAWHRRALRGSGWGLLALVGWLCIAAWGAGVGLVMWFACLTVAALSVAGGLPYRPRLVVVAAMVAMFAAGVLAGLA
jgi:hypothetical protein